MEVWGPNMTISRKKLAESIVKEGCEVVPDHNEGSMAQRQLFNMENNARELLAMLPDDAELPEWVSAKLTKAADYLDSVKDYLSFDAYHGEYDRVEGCGCGSSPEMGTIIAQIVELLSN